MTDTSHTDAAVTLVRLCATLDQPGLSPRAATRCARLIDRLQKPVRVAVLGLPGVGKAAVVNALADANVLQSGAQPAPVLLRYADTARFDVTYADGHRALAPVQTPVSLPEDVLFADIALPLDALTRMTVLNVVAEPVRQDLAAALGWAAPQCDIAIWCTRHWTVLEQEVWWRGPDALKNHALMVASAGADALEGTPADRYGLEQNLCAISLTADGDALTAESADILRRRLARMIDAARAEDLDAAGFVIEQFASYGPVPTNATAVANETGQEAPDLRVVGASVVGVAPKPADDALPLADAGTKANLLATSTPEPISIDAETAQKPVASDEAYAALSRVFLHVRQAAYALSDDVPEGGLDADTTQALLTRFQEAFETLLDLAEAEQAFGDTWPGLLGTLQDASELVLLLRIEGTAVQAVEAAVLLAQVRRDVDYALAA